MSKAVNAEEWRSREPKRVAGEDREANAKPTTGGERKTMQAKDTPGLKLAASAARRLSSDPARIVGRGLSKYLFFALVAVVALCLALAVGAEAALAQEGGEGGDAISQTLTNVRNYLAGLAFGVGGIGFVASLLVKGYASINENAHAYAAMGMKGSLWCIVAGAIVTPVLSIASGLAASGG